METALVYIRSEAPRLLLLMMVPTGLIFFGAFFAAVTKERRRNQTQKPTRAVLGGFQKAKDAPRSRYAYAMEQQEREPLVYQQIQPIYFRGRKLSVRGRR